MVEKEGPNRPEPGSVSLDSKTRCLEIVLRIAFLALPLALLSFVRVGPTLAQPLTKVRMANGASTSDHLEVAIKAGIYRKYGFEIENILVTSPVTVVQSLIAGEVDFAQVGAVPVVAAVANGASLKIVAVYINRFYYILVSVPEVRAPEDLKGKIVAISRLGSGDEFATQEALRRWNLIPDKDVRLLQVGRTPERLAALVSRRVHATLLSPTHVGVAQRFGLNILADLADLDVEYPHIGLVSKGSLIAENRSLVERFLKAYVEGIKNYRRHPEQAMAYLSKFVPEGELKIAYESLRKRLREEPVPTAGGIQTVLRSLKEKKERELDPRRVIDASFLTGTAFK